MPLGDPLSYPRCERCGHESGSHTTTACSHYTSMEMRPDGTLNIASRRYCDCPGWKRDTGWPPQPIQESVAS